MLRQDLNERFADPSGASRNDHDVALPPYSAPNWAVGPPPAVHHEAVQGAVGGFEEDEEEQPLEPFRGLDVIDERESWARDSARAVEGHGGDESGSTEREGCRV